MCPPDTKMNCTYINYQRLFVPMSDMSEGMKPDSSNLIENICRQSYATAYKPKAPPLPLWFEIPASLSTMIYTSVLWCCCRSTRDSGADEGNAEGLRLNQQSSPRNMVQGSLQSLEDLICQEGLLALQVKFPQIARLSNHSTEIIVASSKCCRDCLTHCSHSKNCQKPIWQRETHFWSLWYPW